MELFVQIIVISGIASIVGIIYWGIQHNRQKHRYLFESMENFLREVGIIMPMTEQWTLSELLFEQFHEEASGEVRGRNFTFRFYEKFTSDRKATYWTLEFVWSCENPQNLEMECFADREVSTLAYPTVSVLHGEKEVYVRSSNPDVTKALLSEYFTKQLFDHSVKSTLYRVQGKQVLYQEEIQLPYTWAEEEEVLFDKSRLIFIVEASERLASTIEKLEIESSIIIPTVAEEDLKEPMSDKGTKDSSKEEGTQR